MKPRLQASLGQHLVMTPQLQQAIRLLQLSAAELELEMTAALESNPLLARSIRNRFPYIDPLNHVQIELLRRHRAGDTAPS